MIIEKILKKVQIKFKNDISRLNHIIGVYQKSIELALFYKVDIVHAQIASLMHDYTRNEPLEFHLSVLDKNIIEKYKNKTFVYHAFSASFVLEKYFGVKDKKIINAINNHVLGHKNMNKLDKIIFISDKIEINRKYPQVNIFRKMVFQDLSKTFSEILELNFNIHKEKTKIKS
ncbi:HD domain-containing protein [Texas Phoenix palm phytoplasma]|uniref:HD domain-containing protein n=1 Tax=Texas Phoenix palm phytoplasma TaxID=176709 RepID=A0ABS5BHW5_9MOLU|nr:bis(5'-nucleosyl)-tetraphosphatase (symmetrical) YqeK [Texas Phoenix palm phytoplasma]MBP3059178.1 HD domain-containing protein [Texas Phoenix palm phytoplasma]